MPGRNNFSGRVIEGVLNHHSIACRTLLSGVHVTAASGRRIRSRFPGVGTIWEGGVTVEATHGIYRVVFLVVPALAGTISGNDGKEVELDRVR
jgi:hypothetical protein